MKGSNECFRSVYLDLRRLGLPGKSPCLEVQCRMKSSCPLYFPNRTCEILIIYSLVLFLLKFPLNVDFVP